MKYSHRLIFSCVFLPLRRESAASRLSRRFGEAKRNASETQSKSIVLRSACANGARLETAAEKVDEVKKVHLLLFFFFECTSWCLHRPLVHRGGGGGGKDGGGGGGSVEEDGVGVSVGDLRHVFQYVLFSDDSQQPPKK